MIRALLFFLPLFLVVNTYGYEDTLGDVTGGDSPVYDYSNGSARVVEKNVKESVNVNGIDPIVTGPRGGEVVDFPPTMYSDIPAYETDEKGNTSIIVDPTDIVEPPVSANKSKIKSRKEVMNRDFKDLRFGTMPICGCGERCHMNDGYGMRRRPKGSGLAMHRGRDITGPEGMPVVAIESGIVFVRRKDASIGYGRQLEVEHNRNFSSRYAHLQKIVRSEGYVTKGELIGYLGSSGYSTGPHLHFEIIQYGNSTKFIKPRNSSRAGKKARKINGDLEKVTSLNGNLISPTKINPNVFMGLKENYSQKKNTSAKLFKDKCSFKKVRGADGGSNNEEPNSAIKTKGIDG